MIEIEIKIKGKKYCAICSNDVDKWKFVISAFFDKMEWDGLRREKLDFDGWNLSESIVKFIFWIWKLREKKMREWEEKKEHEKRENIKIRKNKRDIEKEGERLRKREWKSIREK